MHRGQSEREYNIHANTTYKTLGDDSNFLIFCSYFFLHSCNEGKVNAKVAPAYGFGDEGGGGMIVGAGGYAVDWNSTRSVLSNNVCVCVYVCVCKCV